MRKTNRTISILLCIVMLLTLLPTAAMAEERDPTDNLLTDVELKVSLPSLLSPLDFEPELEDAAPYMLDVDFGDGGVQWYDITAGRYASAEDHAIAGHEYELRVGLTTKNTSDCFKQGVTIGRVNGNDAETEIVHLYDSDVIVKYRFKEDGVLLTNAGVSSLAEPTPGAKPYYGDFQILNFEIRDTTGSEGFHNGLNWVDVTDPAKPKALTPDSVFEKSHIYQVNVALAAVGDNRFDLAEDGVTPAVDAEVNHKTAVASQWGEPGKSLLISYTFPACDYQEVSHVKISEVSAPAHGKTPDYSAVLGGYGYELKPTSDSNPFCVNGVTWHDETEDYDLTATGKFIAGHTYSVSVFLVPEAGYRFAEEVTAVIDGETATVTGNGSAIELRYTYPALPINKIESVTIEGVSAPVLNQFPSYVAIVRGEGYGLKDRNDAYYRNGMCWSVMDGTSLPVSGSTFAGGTAYQLEIYLVAEEGYAFAATAGGALEVKATVNGKQAAVAGNAREILLTCYFPEPTDEAEITNVAVTGLSAPVAGASPDYTVEILDTRYESQVRDTVNNKNGITWINNETGNALSAYSGKFEPGVSYTAVISLQSCDGYAFRMNKDGEPEVAAYVNGNEVKELTARSEMELTLWYTFPAIPETSFTDVPTGAYYYEPVMWAVANGITNGTGDGSTFSPDMNCTRAQVVTFLWRAAGSPAPKSRDMTFTDVPYGTYYYDAVLWAVEQGITSGTGGTNFSPDMDCSRGQIVTFLWRSQGSPAPESTIIPFMDVKEGQYYTNAVLWAVEQGITKGTGDGSTFSPDMICTRAQIVTFLYRCMGSES